MERRDFLKNMVGAAGVMVGLSDKDAVAAVGAGGGGDSASSVYRSVKGSPAENIQKVVELAGGIGRLIADRDVVVIKPNVQWWNQGAPNLQAARTLVDLIMERPGGFSGEVVIAENCHRGKTPWTSAGWANQFERNGDLKGIAHYGQLTAALKKRYGNRYSTVHWIDVSAGGKRVFGPGKEDGYVYCDGTGGVPLIACGNGLKGKGFRQTIMTYPVFASELGTWIDFKNGIWEKGAITGWPLKFINLAALNHHSTYCGMTSAVKNYLGISDLSGGPDPETGGKLTGGYYNFHSFPFNHWASGPEPGMIGNAVGEFMRTIRRADLNITTAEWTGLSSRTEGPVAHTRAVLASTDPVALDYHAAKYLLYLNSRLGIHDPDRSNGPLRQYLERCADTGAGVLDEGRAKVMSYDLAVRRMQFENELPVRGEITWGRDPKALLKYLVLRVRGA
jgi:hypothetical protein